MPIGLCIAYGCFCGIKPEQSRYNSDCVACKTENILLFGVLQKNYIYPILAKFHEERVLILFVLRILYSKQKSSCRIHK